LTALVYTEYQWQTAAPIKIWWIRDSRSRTHDRTSGNALQTAWGPRACRPSEKQLKTSV